MDSWRGNHDPRRSSGRRGSGYTHQSLIPSPQSPSARDFVREGEHGHQHPMDQYGRPLMEGDQSGHQPTVREDFPHDVGQCRYRSDYSTAPTTQTGDHHRSTLPKFRDHFESSNFSALPSPEQRYRSSPQNRWHERDSPPALAPHSRHDAVVTPPTTSGSFSRHWERLRSRSGFDGNQGSGFEGRMDAEHYTRAGDSAPSPGDVPTRQRQSFGGMAPLGLPRRSSSLDRDADRRQMPADGSQDLERSMHIHPAGPGELGAGADERLLRPFRPRMRSRASGDGNFAPFNSRPEGPSGLPVAEVHGLGVRKSSQGTIHDITGAYRSSFSGASTESGVETAQTSRSRDGSAFPNEFSQAFEAPPPQLRGLFFQNLESRTFKLTARQQPRHGRLCGFGIKDKRPLDPLPIIQLEVRREDGEIDEDAHNSPNLVMQAFLKRVDTETGENNEVPLVAHMTERTFPWTRMLEGKLAASGHVVRDLDGSKACFFVFTDLSVRLEGVFILHFSLIVLGGESSSSGGIAGGKVVASIDSEPFTVYSPRRFPGMTESTELAKLLARQGVQVPIRNDVRKRSEEKAI